MKTVKKILISLAKIPNIIKVIFHLNLWIIIPYLVLCILGIIMVYSSSSDIGNPLLFMIKQTAYVLFGFLIIYGAQHVNIKAFRKTATVKIMLGVIIGLLVFVKFLGRSINGAAGWIPLGVINFQPSEFAKLFFILYISNIVAHRQKELITHSGGIQSRKIWLERMIAPMIATFVICVLILIQPDLGSAIINFVIVLVLFLFGGAWRYKTAVSAFLGIVALSGLSLVYLLVPLSETSATNHWYQLQRILAFAQPFSHSQGIGKQLVNSYYALSNGGIFGVGLGNSIQKAGYLPEPNTDFIMAIVAEELGLIAIIGILILLMILISEIVLIGIRESDGYYSLICYGVATFITIETFFNVGGVTGMLPITGVTFPFISYGGSSIIVLSMCIGLVLRISATQKRRNFKIRLKR